MTTPDLRADLTIVGAGAAGSYAALWAAQAGADVVLISSSPRAETASWWAQGGLAAAIDHEDSPELHLSDTLTAGRDLVRRSAAELLCQDAPARFRDLQRLGVAFDRDHEGRVKLSLEGGHSTRRVAHAMGSSTGMQILKQLSSTIADEERITVLNERLVVALLHDKEDRCRGVVLDDGRTIRSRAVLLATGGAAALWSRTTNPGGSSGAGLQLASTMGATLADLEFVQFHPTAVTGIDGLDGFLISEAVRGEGATLHDSKGERFVDELEPRDVVAKAIHTLLVGRNESAVYLDMRSVPKERFPSIVNALQKAGIDPTQQNIPVAPAAHYTIGGIATDLHGRTSVAGLYAAGECACTGLHGANRLASNSLSECFVFGRRAGLAALSEPEVTEDEVLTPTDAILPPPGQNSRENLWLYAGISRNAEGLIPLLSDPHSLPRLIARSALAREESRGAHTRTDFPNTASDLDNHHTVVSASTEEVSFDEWS